MSEPTVPPASPHGDIATRWSRFWRALRTGGLSLVTVPREVICEHGWPAASCSNCCDGVETAPVRCAMCNREMTTKEASVTLGDVEYPLCHPDDPDLSDCYGNVRMWTAPSPESLAALAERFRLVDYLDDDDA